MNKPKPCPICGAELQIHGPEDWKPSFYDPDSGGDPYNATCDCGFYFSTWTYDYTEFFAALNRRAPLPDNCVNQECPHQRGEPCHAADGCPGFEPEEGA